ncbi:MAG: MFS transporter [Candidatus Thermoplasmatota archaeon]|nr:MFS transporter [Candidatus Thermoplasmatota archaeon]
MDERNKSRNLPRDFSIFVILKSFIALGGGFFSVLLPWAIITLTKSAFLVGIGEGITAVPLLTSFIIGSSIDKIKRKANAFAFSVLGMASFFSFFLFSFYTRETIFIIIALLVPALIISYFDDIQTTISSFFDKALLSQGNLKKGISLRRGTSSLTKIIGIVTFAIFISFGLGVSIYFLIIIYLLSFFIFLTIRRVLSIKTKQNNPIENGGIFSGIKKFLSFRFLKELTLVAIVINFFFGMITVGFTVMIKIYFNLGGVYLSYLLGIWAIGDAVGSLLATKIKNVRGSFVSFSVILWGILFIAIFWISLNYLYYPLLPIVFLIGLISGIMNVLIYALMLKNTDEAVIGSVFGSFNSLFGGVTFISGMISGGILIYFSAPSLFFLMGVSTLTVGIISRIGFKELKSVSF